MKSIFLILFVVVPVSWARLRLGDIIPLCDETSPNVDQCVVKSANLLIPILSRGVKDLDFPPLDPLMIPEMNIDQSNQPISLKLKLVNTIHTGLSTLKFHSASVDTVSNRWVLNATLPYYSLSGGYKANGRLLLIPIIGEGHANFTYSNTKVDFVFEGNRRRQNENAVDIFNLSRLRVYFTFDKCFISITNLFGGNNQLSDTVNQFIGSNSKEVMNGLKGSLEKIYSTLYLGLVRKLVSNVPYSDVFRTTLR